MIPPVGYLEYSKYPFLFLKKFLIYNNEDKGN